MLSLILSRRDFREFDQIISVYTLEKGKLEVLARGIKKITSKNSAHLEPFSFVDAEIIPGKELSHLGAVQPMDYFVNIRKDLDKSLAAGYVVSLLDKLIEAGEKDERIFGLLLNYLEFVDFTKDFNKVLLDAFFVKLLFLLGLDITEREKLPSSVKEDLILLGKSDWQEINNLKYKKPVHDFIYKFLLYNTDRKIADWGKIKQLV